jgi:hypothetical protein
MQKTLHPTWCNVKIMFRCFKKKSRSFKQSVQNCSSVSRAYSCTSNWIYRGPSTKESWHCPFKQLGPPGLLNDKRFMKFLILVKIHHLERMFAEFGESCAILAPPPHPRPICVSLATYSGPAVGSKSWQQNILIQCSCSGQDGSWEDGNRTMIWKPVCLKNIKYNNVRRKVDVSSS